MRISRVVLSLLLALVVQTSARAATSSSTDSTMLRKACEYGVTLAYGGEQAQAESVFISVLSHSPADARALNDLGNVHFLRGEPEVALAFYDWAARSDTADAGIRLNRAAIYMALGKQELAQSEAKEGVRMAGSRKAAASLLGMHDVADQPKASELSARIQLSWSTRKPNQKITLSRDEIRSLLGAEDPTTAPAAVGAESTGADKSKGAGAPASGAVAARAAGTKASDEGSAATLLYWKR